jgi:hypothetical protein
MKQPKTGILELVVNTASYYYWLTLMWRGDQDQKIRQAYPMSNTKDENELTYAKGVPLSRIVLQLRFSSFDLEHQFQC